MLATRIIAVAAALALCAGALAQGRPRPLVRQLRAVARELDLSLVYSPGIVPDTVVRAFDGPAALDSLTLPFGLAYTLVGRQLVVARASQRPYSVAGYVEDALTGERLVGATVVVAGEARGAVSNAYGYFVVPDVSPGDSLDYRYVGYPTLRLAVPGPDRPEEGVVVRLRPSLRLGVVEVTASAAPPPTLLAGTPRPQPPEVLQRSELIAGDRDLNAFLGLIPGVQSAPAGFGGYSIRGAEPSQNLVLLDDATLYLPSHAAGLLSAVPGNAVRSIQLHKDGGPARYGDRVGGVLDIRLKEGTRAGHEVTGAVGLTDVGVAAEGPLGPGSYFVAGRQSITGLWIGSLRRSGIGDLPDVDFGFADLTAKVNFPLAGGQRVYASVFLGGDRYADRASGVVSDETGVASYADESARNAANRIVSLRHAASFGARWFVNTTLTLSEFNYLADDVLRIAERFPGREEIYTFTEDRFRTNLLDLGVRQDISYAARPDLRLSFGVDAVSHRFRVGTSTESGLRQAEPDSTRGASPSVDDLPQLVSYDASVYGSALYEPDDRWRVEVGLRVASQLGLRRPFTAALPRLHASYEIDRRQGLDLSLGTTRQFIHRISTLNPGLPRELYVPTIGRLEPQRSRSVSVGWRRVDSAGRAISIGAYGQLLDGLSRFDSAFVGRGLSNWATNVRGGSGWARGVEVEAVAPLGELTAGLTYTFARSQRTYEDQFGDQLLPERYILDRRHYATATLTSGIGERWDASATLRVGSGLPARVPSTGQFSRPLPEGAVALTNNLSYDGRLIGLPPFHSLDVGARYQAETTRALWRLAFGIQNVYANSNPLFVSLQAVPESEPGSTAGRLTQVSLFPVLPFARVSATLRHASDLPNRRSRGTNGL